ncbi:RNA-directed DNA polymerase [Actinoallomurus sp. NPDC050550]|uniref:RNA-directed DNA polymerase n=1 Tax=Actinoallomurus sp. NPDC050550 TaxID=3154937 RepID=UPI0033DBC8FE
MRDSQGDVVAVGGIEDIPDLDSFEGALDFAWRRFLKNQDEVELPDVIRLADIEYQWDMYRRHFVEMVEGGGYTPGYVEVVDLPKDELTVRPLARLRIEDRLYYEACVFSMVSKIDIEIPRVVYSYRWSDFKGDLRRPVGSWVRMRKYGRTFNQRHPALLMARTDVSAFYENINVGILVQELRQLKVDEQMLVRLHDFLHTFQEMNHVWGLPQGCDASGILANLYLLPVDRIITRSALQHMRYSDDIFIFGPDREILRHCLLEVNRAMRGRRLSMSGHKTEIFDAKDVPQVFDDMEKDAIRYNANIGSDSAPAEVRKYFDQATEGVDINERDARFSLNLLKKLDDPYAIDWIVRNFEHVPQMAQDLVNYLEHFAGYPDKVRRFCTEAISKRVFKGYPYAELHILGFMMRQDMHSLQAYEAAWGMLRDRNEETFLREYAARYVGRNARPGDGALLRQEFRRDPSFALRRALLVAIYETRQDDASWFGRAAQAVPDLRWVCRYLESEPEVPLPPARRYRG